MGAAFTWMRPDDLVWNYWVNNYLMGEKPPAFDVLAWNADGTNLPGALHCEFLDIFANNGLAKPGAVTVLGTPIQLDRIKIPTFVTGAVTDHLTPWMGCYRTTQLLGGESTFVLSYSGHIASLVNPPGNPKAHYWTGGTPGPDPQQWLKGAEKHTGSWWEAWAEWLEVPLGRRPAGARRAGQRRAPGARPRPRAVRARPARVIPTAGTDPPSRVPPWRSASTPTRTATVLSCPGPGAAVIATGAAPALPRRDEWPFAWPSSWPLTWPFTWRPAARPPA